MNDDGTPQDVLEKEAALHGCATVADAAANADYRAALEAGVKAANANAISRAQTVQKFAVLPADFTQETGELTPTMKLKRKVVLEKYADVVAGLYK
jgi:long-subunit acyl-CoA synthetase (AMP-forming)